MSVLQSGRGISHLGRGPGLVLRAAVDCDGFMHVLVDLVGGDAKERVKVMLRTHKKDRTSVVPIQKFGMPRS